MGTKKTVPTALARVEHDAAPVKLNVAQRAVLDEALRRGEDLREQIESKTLEYGRWMLEKIFSNDTTAALDDRTVNPLWQELLRRAGGPTLGINRRLLYTTVRLAAADRRISAQAWRGLDAGRKEILLPLHDDHRLLEAARHVSDLNLSQSKTREYVTALMSEDGRSRQVRVTPRLLAGRLTQMKNGLGGDRAVRNLRDMLGEMKRSDRTALESGLRDLQRMATEMLKVVRVKK